MFNLSVKIEFAAAHSLRDYPGACANVHGHNWKTRVEVASRTLDDLGMALDFVELQKMVENVTNKFDHRYINEIPPFNDLNPTAENIAKFIYAEVEKQLPENITVSHVTVWENEIYRVVYSE